MKLAWISKVGLTLGILALCAACRGDAPATNSLDMVTPTDTPATISSDSLTVVTPTVPPVSVGSKDHPVHVAAPDALHSRAKGLVSSGGAGPSAVCAGGATQAFLGRFAGATQSSRDFASRNVRASDDVVFLPLSGHVAPQRGAAGRRHGRGDGSACGQSRGVRLMSPHPGLSCRV